MRKIQAIRGLGCVVTLLYVGVVGAGQAPCSEPAEGVRALQPTQLAWQTMKPFTDGRERVDLVGDPSQGGSWIYRVRVPNPIQVLPHTHSVDEHITVLEGTWYLGSGSSFSQEALIAYPAGSFVVIPAGTAHFVATGEGPVVIQSSGEGVFTTQFIEPSSAPDR